MKWKVRDLIIENFSYKIVSVFIALILWITILGRRDYVLQKSIEVEVIPSIGMLVQSQSAELVKVKVSGPRAALKKFVESGVSQLLTIDASEKAEGVHEFEVPVGKIDIPFGVKIVSVKPSRVQVKISPRL